MGNAVLVFDGETLNRNETSCDANLLSNDDHVQLLEIIIHCELSHVDIVEDHLRE